MKYKLKTFTAPALVAEDRTLNQPELAVEYLRPIFEGLDGDREHFVVLALNVRMRPVGYKVVSTGHQTACLVSPREVFQAAIVLGAVAIVVAHNHPSGVSTPSEEDRALTRRLYQGAEVLGIQLLDHLVLAGPRGEEWSQA